MYVQLKKRQFFSSNCEDEQLVSCDVKFGFVALIIQNELPKKKITKYIATKFT